MCMEICCKELSQIAQSGPTGCDWSKTNLLTLFSFSFQICQSRWTFSSRRRRIQSGPRRRPTRRFTPTTSTSHPTTSSSITCLRSTSRQTWNRTTWTTTLTAAAAWMSTRTLPIGWTRWCHPPPTPASRRPSPKRFCPNWTGTSAPQCPTRCWASIRTTSSCRSTIRKCVRTRFGISRRLFFKKINEKKLKTRKLIFNKIYNKKIQRCSHAPTQVQIVQ